MDCPTLSLLAFALVTILLAWMVAGIKGGSTPYTSGFFAHWRDVLTAFREAEGRPEQTLITVLAVAQLLRTGGWGVAAVTAGAGYPAATAICWEWPEIIRAAGEVLNIAS